MITVIMNALVRYEHHGQSLDTTEGQTTHQHRKLEINTTDDTLIQQAKNERHRKTNK